MRNLIIASILMSLSVSACALDDDIGPNANASSDTRDVARSQTNDVEVTDVPMNDDQNEEPGCTVIENTILGEGYAPRFAMNDAGYAVLWADEEGFHHFRSFDWTGVPVSEEIIFINARAMTGGRDDFLISLKEGDRYRFSVIDMDGKEKIAVNVDSDASTPTAFSFDGDYYRIVKLLTNEAMGNGYFLGCNGATQYGFASARVSVDGDMVTDQESWSKLICVNGNISADATIANIIERQDALPLVYVENPDPEIPMSVSRILADLEDSSSWQPLQDNATQKSIVASDEGPLVKWHNGDMWYVTTLNDDHVGETYALPNGMQPNVIDGSEIIDIVHDSLAETDSIVRSTLHGEEILRQEIDGMPVEQKCYRDLYGHNGTYINLGDACLPSDDEVDLVTMRVIACN